MAYDSDKAPFSEPQNIEAFARNMAQVFDTYQQVWKLYLETHSAEEVAQRAETMNAMPAFMTVMNAMAQKPDALMEATQAFWANQFAIWQTATNKMMGAPTADAEASLPNLPEGGRRFSHPQWTENAVFEAIKRSYLLATDWTTRLVHEAESELDPAVQKQIDFLTRNFIEAMNPANFFGLNPEVLQSTVEENGANLVRGARMLLEDMQRGRGELLIRHTDMDAFAVGENMAVSPGEVIYRGPLFELIQYAPTTETVHSTPLLIIPPWINKYYVLDLNQKKSLVRWLVEQGHTVFMVSWVNPGPAQRDDTWESYMEKGAETAIDKVLEETGAGAVNVASYCIGGTLVGSLMAKLSRAGDTRVRSTTFFTAQLDFQDAGELQVFVNDTTLKLIDAHLEDGYFPAESMAQAFNLLRSNDLIWSYVVSNYMLGKDPFPFDLLYWNSDSTAMPTRVHHYYLEEFYIRNALTAGTLPIDGQTYGIGDIAGPVYHVATVEDHIAPASSVYRGARQMAHADVTFILSASGHIAGVVNPPASKKYQYWTGEDLAAESLEDWQSAATATQGSWWPHWHDWLVERSDGEVPARQPGATLGSLAPAPGTYVTVRSDALGKGCLEFPS